MANDREEMKELEERVYKEMVSMIVGYEGDSIIEEEIQPPKSIIEAAARAAAQVFIAFERGYRMDSDERN